MPALGLVALVLYGLLAVAARMAVQLRRTGSTGFKGLRAGAGFRERLAGLLFVAALVLCVAGPALQLAGALSALGTLEGGAANMLGIALAALGIVTTSVAQFAMGDAWRVGVDPSEGTQLVTGGLFSVVRNPIYTAMLTFFVGVALLAPNAVTIAGALLLLLALELQTRLIEEPYLSSVHGKRYDVYAAQVGRFIPEIGRLRRGVPQQ